MAQDKGDTLPELHFKIDTKALRLQPVKPLATSVSPDVVTPSLNNYKALEMPSAGRLSKLDGQLRALPEWNMSVKPLRVAPVYDFRMNPFSRDWSASGVITTFDDLYLTGSGSRISLPALGNMESGSLALTGVYDDRLSLTAGVTGMKYHMGRDAWNDYGIFGRANYRISDRLSVSAFSQYYFDQRYHSVGAMGYMQGARYGGTFDMKLSDKFGLNLGAQRYYDPYTHRWHTLPIVAPVITLWGQPFSVDVGGLVYQIIESLLDKRKSYGAAPSGPVNMGFRTSGAPPIPTPGMSSKAMGGTWR